MRLIDADELYVDARFSEDEIPYVSAKQISEQPTVDAVPVVRCKDCEHYDAEYRRCFRSIGYGRYWKPDDFCSYGERKDETN